jgi:hypothetical protein
MKTSRTALPKSVRRITADSRKPDATRPNRPLSCLQM